MENKLEQAIRDRLTNGFKNWNGGYDQWLEWCNTLYEPDAYYNVQGEHWTLQQYKDAMKKLFAHFDVKLGEFKNMLVENDWCGIRYVIHVTNKDTGEKLEQESWEFVHFKDNPEPVGARVIEGWAMADKPLTGKK